MQNSSACRKREEFQVHLANHCVCEPSVATAEKRKINWGKRFKGDRMGEREKEMRLQKLRQRKAREKTVALL